MRVKKFSFSLLSLLSIALVSLAVFAPGAFAASKRLDNPVVKIVKDVSPAVVNIDVETMTRRQPNPLYNDPFFRHFFGGGV